MKEKIYNILKILVCFICFFNIGNITVLLLKLLGIDVNSISDKGMVIYQLFVSLIMFIILLILYKKDIKEDFIKFKKNIKNNIAYIIKLFVIFIVVKYIVSFITTLIITLAGFDISNVTSVNQTLIEGYVKSAPLLMILSTSVLAPFYEEAIFRLGIRKIINNKFLFIIISGASFGLLHIFPLDEGVTLVLGLMQSLIYVTMGIFLAYSYRKTDNIFISIGIHFLNNFLSVLTMINMM